MPTPIIWIEDIFASSLVNKGSIQLNSSEQAGVYKFTSPFTDELSQMPAFNISFRIQGTIHDLMEITERTDDGGRYVDLFYTISAHLPNETAGKTISSLTYYPLVEDGTDVEPYLRFYCAGVSIKLPDLTWLDGEPHYISYQGYEKGAFIIYQDGFPVDLTNDNNITQVKDESGNIIYTSSLYFDYNDLKYLDSFYVRPIGSFTDVSIKDFRFYTEILTQRNVVNIIVENDGTAPELANDENIERRLQIMKAIAALPSPVTPDYFFDYFKWYHEITSANLPKNITDVFKDTKDDIHRNQWGVVDLDTREITPPKTFGITSDQRAEIIFFAMPRYCAGFDLSKSIGVIEYINAKNEKYTYGIPFFDIVSLNKEFPMPEDAVDADVYEKLKKEQQKVVFPWVVSSQVTAAAGPVVFAMSFYMLNDDGTLKFAVNTKSAKSIVEQGIEIDPAISGLIDDLQLPSIEQLYQLYRSIDHTNSGFGWETVFDGETETRQQYRDYVTIPH